MDQIDLSNPVLAVALLTQRIAELEQSLESAHAELSSLLQQRGALLMAMGDKEGAEKDMQRFLQLNPEKIGELNGEFKAEGREQCR